MEPYGILFLWQTPLPFVGFVLACRVCVIVSVIVSQVTADRRKTQRREAEPVARFTRPPLELSTQEKAAGWRIEQGCEGARFKVLEIDCCRPHRPMSPRPFLERHQGPHLTKEDIARWWEELKDHEF